MTGRETTRRTGRHAAVIDCVYDAVLIVERDGSVVDWNARAADMLAARDESEGESPGPARDALAGLNVLDVVSGGDALLEGVRRNLRDGRFTLLDADCTRRDGSSFPAEIAVKAFGSRAEQIVFVIHDARAQKREKAGLKEARARLDAHRTAHAQFVSSVSHELRTPLTAMIYAVSNLLRGVAGEVPRRVRTYLEMLQGDCTRLMGTVSDILDLHQIENRALSLGKTRVALNRVVARCAVAVSAKAAAKGLSLDVAPSEEGAFAEIDVRAFERVLLNVLDNAVKYTPHGGRVEVGVKVEDGERKVIRVSVLDSGVGIPDADIDKVTVRYYRVGEQSDGAGLGLAVAKKIVELHGGALSVRSPVPGTECGTAVQIDMPACGPPRALVVSGVGEVGRRLFDQLHGAGYEVAASPDVDQAINALEQETSHVLILGLDVAVQDGGKALCAMRSGRRARDVPVVAVATQQVGNDQAALLKCLAVPVLPVPWQEWELLDGITGGPARPRGNV